MTAIAFDALKLAKRLEAAGFPPAQAGATAEALAATLRDSLGESLGTRDFLDARLGVRLAELKEELTTRVVAPEIALTGKIAESKVDMMRWGVGFLLGQTALLAALIKLP